MAALMHATRRPPSSWYDTNSQMTRREGAVAEEYQTCRTCTVTSIRVRGYLCVIASLRCVLGANAVADARRGDDSRLERSLHGEGHLSELSVTSAPAAITTRIRRAPPLAFWPGEGCERARARKGRTVVLLGRAPSFVRPAHEREDLGQPHLEVSRPIDTRAVRAGRARASKAAAHAPYFIGPPSVLAQARDCEEIEAVHPGRRRRRAAAPLEQVRGVSGALDTVDRA